MSIGIKTNKPWQKHAPVKSHKFYGSYYEELVKKRRARIKRIIYLIIFILLLQSIFQAPLWRLRKVVVNGQESYSQQDIVDFVLPNLEQKRFLIFQNNNFFLFDSSHLESELVGHFNLEQARVNKSFPQTIKITIKEKVSQFVWQKNGNKFLLDARAQVIGQSNNNNQLIILDDQRSYQPSGDKDIFREDEINLIQTLISAWNDKLDNLVKISSIRIDDNWSLWQIGTNFGYSVKINPQDDLNSQLNNLYQLLKPGNVVGTDINYIDLRFGDKAYFQ